MPPYFNAKKTISINYGFVTENKENSIQFNSSERVFFVFLLCEIEACMHATITNIFFLFGHTLSILTPLTN
jgi:hypothetical protein